MTEMHAHIRAGISPSDPGSVYASAYTIAILVSQGLQTQYVLPPKPVLLQGPDSLYDTIHPASQTSKLGVSPHTAFSPPPMSGRHPAHGLRLQNTSGTHTPSSVSTAMSHRRLSPGQGRNSDLMAVPAPTLASLQNTLLSAAQLSFQNLKLIMSHPCSDPFNTFCSVDLRIETKSLRWPPGPHALGPLPPLPPAHVKRS